MTPRTARCSSDCAIGKYIQMLICGNKEVLLRLSVSRTEEYSGRCSHATSMCTADAPNHESRPCPAPGAASRRSRKPGGIPCICVCVRAIMVTSARRGEAGRHLQLLFAGGEGGEAGLERRVGSDGFQADGPQGSSLVVHLLDQGSGFMPEPGQGAGGSQGGRTRQGNREQPKHGQEGGRVQDQEPTMTSAKACCCKDGIGTGSRLPLATRQAKQASSSTHRSMASSSPRASFIAVGSSTRISQARSPTLASNSS